MRFIETDGTTFDVLVGEHDTMNHLDKAVKHKVTCIKKHPSYNPKTFNNDYAVLTLDKAIDLTGSNSAARAACLPNSQDTKFVEGTTKFVVSGWGETETKVGAPSTLHHVQVPFVGQSTCKRGYPALTDRMLCAGNFKNGGIDSCQGDSGG